MAKGHMLVHTIARGRSQEDDGCLESSCVERRETLLVIIKGQRERVSLRVPGMG